MEKEEEAMIALRLIRLSPVIVTLLILWMVASLIEWRKGLMDA